MAGNRVITFMEPFKLQVETIDYPKLANPQGKKIERGAILRSSQQISAAAISTSTTAASRRPKGW